MRNPFHTSFAAVFRNEVLINSKRVAPYALMILFAANAVLWWAWGPAVRLGWATNSDYYIVRNFLGFSFLLGLPIFNAVIMADPVIRDFRLGMDPFIFSKPINRAEYLLGKFCGNFLVLVCCQAAFALTLLVLQMFRTSHMIVQPMRVLPYLKHFFFFVVISHLALAALYFTVGTLTRNAKIVYGLSVCFYPLYIFYQAVVLKDLTPVWRTLLDPMLLNSGVSGGGLQYSANFLNRFVVTYSFEMIANRVLVILVAAVCLAILYVRFSTTDRSASVEKLSNLNLVSRVENIYYDSESVHEPRSRSLSVDDSIAKAFLSNVSLPRATIASEGFRTNLNKLRAATDIEFRLLRAERSLIVIMPMAIFLSTMELAFYNVVADVSYSVAYASGTAKILLLFLLVITLFYTGESIHRDREVRIEPVLWATPIPTHVLLLSKFLSTFLLALFLITLVGVTAIVIQLTRGHGPIEVSVYVAIYSVILIPSVAVMTGLSMALSILVRDKYVAYVLGIATGASLFYIYSLGYNHWLYNPVLYQLWTYADLAAAGGNRDRILIHRLYCLAIAALCAALAHLAFKRKTSSKNVAGYGGSSYSSWALLGAAISLGVVLITGLMIVFK
jgi:ABC-2 type transport system permease protein